MATSFTAPGTASHLQVTDALTNVMTVPSLPDGMLCILVTEAGFGGTIANIVDTAGHNYMANLHSSTDPVNNNFSAFSYINNCQGYGSGTNTITITWTAPMHAWLRLFWYFQGEMVLDQWDVTHLSAPTGNFSGATLTPNYEGSLIFSYLATHTSAGDFVVSNMNAGAGFRVLLGTGSGTDCAEDRVQATIAPIAATWTSDLNSRNSVWTLVFRPYGWLQNNDSSGSAYIQNGLATTHYSFLNGPVNNGGTVVLFFGWNDATVDAPVISDNAAGFTNNYTVLAPLVPGDAHVWYAAYCSNVRGHPTQVNIVTQHTPGAILTQIVELGGVWSFDSSDKRRIAGPGGGGANYPLGAVTPVRNGALIYGVSVQYGGTSDTTRVSGPFRRTFTAVIEPSTMIQATAATITPTYNSNDNIGLASFVLAFDPVLQLPLAAGMAGSGALTANAQQLQPQPTPAPVQPAAVIPSSFVVSPFGSGPVDWGATVLTAAMNAFAVNVMVTPIRSMPNAPPYAARGIWRQKPTMETLGGEMLWSTTQPTLGIYVREFPATPMKDDQVQVLPGQPVDRIGSGYFTIIDPVPDGQGGVELRLKDRFGPGV